MTTGIVDSGFPTGTNMDQMDVGILGFGTISAQSATGFQITIGSERLVFSGVGMTFDGLGNPTGGTINTIEDQYLGAVNYDLRNLSIPVASFMGWVRTDDNASADSAIFGGADTLTGASHDDVLRAYGGNDSIVGAGGDDTIDGGLGNDTLNGGAGHDAIATGGGVDTILIGSGESAPTQAGADVVTGWNASDIITFATGPAGASDYKEISAADFASALSSANGLIATGAANVVAVAVGSDVVVFADSANNNGGADDAVVLKGMTLADVSVANFTLSSSVTPPPVSPPPPPPPPVSPPPPPTPPPTGGVGTGSPAPAPTAGNDVLTATSSSTEIHAGAGNDTITGAGVPDYLRGDDGDDVINGGSAFDDINGNMGNDTAHGNAGDDWVVGGKNDDMLFGDAGVDIVWGNLGNDTLDGGDGNDQVRGGQGDDVINGGAGDDYVSGDRGNDTVTGGAGADTFHTFDQAGIDRVLDFHVSEGDRVMVDVGTSYTVNQVGSDTVIDMGAGNQMILVGVQMSSLPAGWIFAG